MERHTLASHATRRLQRGTHGLTRVCGGGDRGSIRRLCPSTVETENEEEKQKAAASTFDVDATHPIDVITADRDDVIMPFRTYLNHASSVRLTPHPLAERVAQRWCVAVSLCARPAGSPSWCAAPLQERPKPPIWRCNINGLYAQTPYEFVVQALAPQGDGARSEPTALKFTLPAQVRRCCQCCTAVPQARRRSRSLRHPLSLAWRAVATCSARTRSSLRRCWTRRRPTRWW